MEVVVYFYLNTYRQAKASKEMFPVEMIDSILLDELDELRY